MLFVLSYENWHKIFIVHIYIYVESIGQRVREGKRERKEERKEEEN